MDAKLKYWKGCVLEAAEGCGAELTCAQLDAIAEAVMGCHDNYDLAFHNPAASDRMDHVEREWRAKCFKLEEEFATYRRNAESVVKKVLRLPNDAKVVINRYGEVERFR